MIDSKEESERLAREAKATREERMTGVRKVKVKAANNTRGGYFEIPETQFDPTIHEVYAPPRVAPPAPESEVEKHDAEESEFEEDENAQ